MFWVYLAVLFLFGTWTLALRAAPGIVGRASVIFVPSGIFLHL